MTERTLIILKPDAVARRLVGRIISRFEQKGFKIIGAKWLRISKELARKHYAVHSGKPFFEAVVDYLSSGPVLVMALEGRNAISVCRHLIGATDGAVAQAGTIRGDFGITGCFNLVHGSDSPSSAEYELNLFFSQHELVDYAMPDEQWLNDPKES